MTPKTAATSVRPADPCCFVIFGASGDLTHRLLVPALYNLAAAGVLPDAFSVIGVARRKLTSDAFRQDLEKSLHEFATRPVDDAVAKRLLACVTYVQGEGDDPQTYETLRRELASVERARPTQGNRLFYLATPPSAFAPIGCHLGRSGLAREVQAVLVVRFAWHRADSLDVSWASQGRG